MSDILFSEDATPAQEKDFLDEINLMKAAGKHKNIVSLIGCCTKSSPNFLIVEFASQGDLLSYLRERRKKVKDCMKRTSVIKNASPSQPLLSKESVVRHWLNDRNMSKQHIETILDHNNTKFVETDLVNNTQNGVQ